MGPTGGKLFFQVQFEEPGPSVIRSVRDQCLKLEEGVQKQCCGVL